MKSQGQISWDRMSALPEDITAKILTHMPIRDALRTSFLSKKWRYSWTRMPKLVFDDNLVKTSQNSEEIDKSKLVNAIFHVLLLHRAPILEFSLIVNADIFSEIDLIILHLSRSNNINKFIFNIGVIIFYVLPCSFFNLQGLEHLHLTYCIFDPPSMFNGFGMLKTLRFNKVCISFKMLQGFLANCPLLEEFTWIRYGPLELTECTFVELFKCLPSVQVLKLFDFYLGHFDAGGMPHKLPTSLVHLRILVVKLSSLELLPILCVISSSPNLEKIRIDIRGSRMVRCLLQSPNNLLYIQGYVGLNLNHLKEVEIKGFQNHADEMEFFKIIMANSPVLEEARIVLDSDVSVDEEVKMLRDLLLVPFPRASPSAKFIIESAKTYQAKDIYSL